MKPTHPSRLVLTALLALTLWLNACSLPSLGAPTPTPTPTSTLTPTLTPSPTPTETPTPTPTPDPVASLSAEVRDLFEKQSVGYEVGEKGEIIVEPYLDNAKQEKVVLTSFERVDTDDGLNPNILTAKDKNGKLYAYNPDYGWFKVPEVYSPMSSFDWDKIFEEIGNDLTYLDELNQQLNPEKYPVVEEEFITTGAANITAALFYQSLPEEQKIPPQAPKTQFWAYYVPPLYGEGVLCVGPYPSQNGHLAIANYKNENMKGLYGAQTGIPAPFVYSGLWKVVDKDGNIYYSLGVTINNPTTKNPEQKTNLFATFDQNTFEEAAKTMMHNGKDGRSVLLAKLHSLTTGNNVLGIVIQPDEETHFNFNLYSVALGYNPTELPPLQKPANKIFLMFPDDDQEKILEVLAAGVKDGEEVQFATAPVEGLPAEFAKMLLPVAITYR